VEEIPKYINMLSYLFVVVYMLSVQLETTRGEIIKTLGQNHSPFPHTRRARGKTPV
jgi:hypothetical protein